MTDEPTLTEIPDNDNRPVIRQDLAELEQRLEDRLGRRIDDKTEQLRAQLTADMQRIARETRDYFDVAVENIVEELKGANADEISLLHDGHTDHEKRIGTLERQATIR